MGGNMQLEELVTLTRNKHHHHHHHHHNHGHASNNEIMFLIDHVNQQVYWFSPRDMNQGADLEPNCNDAVQAHDLINRLTQRNFLK